MSKMPLLEAVETSNRLFFPSPSVSFLPFVSHEISFASLSLLDDSRRVVTGSPRSPRSTPCREDGLRRSPACGQGTRAPLGAPVGSEGGGARLCHPLATWPPCAPRACHFLGQSPLLFSIPPALLLCTPSSPPAGEVVPSVLSGMKARSVLFCALWRPIKGQASVMR